MKLSEIMVEPNESESLWKRFQQRKRLWFILILILILILIIALIIIITVVIIHTKKKDNNDIFSSTVKIVTTEMMITTENISLTTIKNNNLPLFKEEGIVVAGSIEYGKGLHQLDDPQGIFVTKNTSLFVADYGNWRVVEWKYKSNTSEIVAHDSESSSSLHPSNVILDEEDQSIIIADLMTKQVTRRSSQNQQILVSNIYCWGLAIDKNRSLYFSDVNENIVLKLKKDDNYTTIIAGGNGLGKNMNQLNLPTYLFVDENYSLYISDTNNHRIMKWKKDSKKGIIVAGGNGPGNSLHQLISPKGIIVDNLGYIYISDERNNRIMRWYEGDRQGLIIVGNKVQQIKETNQLSFPQGLTFDVQGNLYVADSGNNRIVKFEKYSK
ncbi:unnamed protein product [Adineta ricciae]|uniref:NHL repeat containing protein n=2 Tax=Adineta ricciae TaxID=249248 RepID=A0A815QWF5_ADIRI|nr:unnamed protein product [Adineta ricciae]